MLCTQNYVAASGSGSRRKIPGPDQECVSPSLKGGSEKGDPTIKLWLVMFKSLKVIFVHDPPFRIPLWVTVIIALLVVSLPVVAVVVVEVVVVVVVVLVSESVSVPVLVSVSASVVVSVFDQQLHQCQ